jgi:hypothetical protein
MFVQLDLIEPEGATVIVPFDRVRLVIRTDDGRGFLYVDGDDVPYREIDTTSLTFQLLMDCVINAK